MISRAVVLFEDWHELQGKQIKEARPRAIYAACVGMARSKCELAPLDVRRIILSAADITKCEERALSSARVAKFGAVPRTEESWLDQIAQVRAEMYGQPPEDRMEAAE